MDFPETLRRLRGVATHVVTGIEQGTRAVMVFERKLADGENRIKANAELFAQVTMNTMKTSSDSIQLIEK